MPLRLDPTIHAALRLQACAALARVGSLDFSTLRERLDVSESVLSKHLKVLEAAGLIRREQQGREHLIHLQPEALRFVADWVQGYEAHWSRQLDRLEAQFRAKPRSKP